MRGKFRAFETALLILGSLLLAVFVLGYARREVMSRAAVMRMEKVKTEPVQAKKTTASVQRRFPVDFSLWSNKRISEYEQSLLSHLDPPTAILRISKIGLEVPVFEGTDDLTLNRAVGHIAGTKQPGEVGNVGIAGHRDSFFRKLKDIGSGDTIELETPDRVDTYRVTQILIVTPDDVSVLQPRAASSLTLVTCYPFYFIGSAPKRYIVEAAFVSTSTPVALEWRAHSLRFEVALENSNRQSQTPAKR